MVVAKALTKLSDYMQSTTPLMTRPWVQSQNNQIFNIRINYDREMFGGQQSGGFFDIVRFTSPHTSTVYSEPTETEWSMYVTVKRVVNNSGNGLLPSDILSCANRGDWFSRLVYCLKYIMVYGNRTISYFIQFCKIIVPCSVICKYENMKFDLNLFHFIAHPSMHISGGNDLL